MEKLIGRTPLKISVNGTEDEIYMEFSDGSYCKFWHEQDCCENVSIESVVGDFNELLGHPFLVADCNSNREDDGGYETTTWTFYTFRSIGGCVDVRWCGTSNGYYSERVSYALYDKDGKVLERD